MTFRDRIVSAALAAPIVLSPLLCAAPARADIVELGTDFGGLWQAFVFEPSGQAWDDQFHFHLSTPGFLEVTDGYQQGDIFDVVANGVDLGRTSEVTPDPDRTFINNFEAAYVSLLMSHGTWTLGPGDYIITGSAVVTPFGFPGGAGIRVEALDFGGPTGPTGPVDPPIDPPTDSTGPTLPPSAAPEPASWALTILGFGGVGALMRRRRAGLAMVGA